MPWQKVRRADGLHCSYCNHTVDSGASSCPGCGKALAPTDPEPSRETAKPQAEAEPSVQSENGTNHNSATPRYCGNCGKSHQLGARFCRYCGRPVSDGDQPDMAKASPRSQDVLKPADSIDRVSAQAPAQLHDRPERGGCLTAMLLLPIVGGPVMALAMLVFSGSMNSTYPGVPTWYWVVSSLGVLTGTVFLIAIWRWQLWAVYALVALHVASSILVYAVWPSNANAVLGVIMTLIWWTVFGLLLYARREGFHAD